MQTQLCKDLNILPKYIASQGILYEYNQLDSYYFYKSTILGEAILQTISAIRLSEWTTQSFYGWAFTRIYIDDFNLFWKYLDDSVFFTYEGV